MLKIIISHVDIIMLHVDIIQLACRGQMLATMLGLHPHVRKSCSPFLVFNDIQLLITGRESNKIYSFILL